MRAATLLIGATLALAPAASPPAGASGGAPDRLPEWLDSRRADHRFYRRGVYNFDVYNIPALARDLNAVAVGHALAYEDLVTGRAATLDTRTFERIDRVLKSPPRLMPDEASLSPSFVRKYGVLERVFDWTHVLHAQTVDVLVSTDLTEAGKDREIERLWRFYSESVPYAITGLPMNMGFLDSQPYSGAFRRKFPRVNGLFWGYHWLQGAMYDGLYRVPLDWQRKSYEILGARYREVELYRTDRPFMPMFAEMSPRFAARFPQIANAFDNLHMLHDMVNDILAADGLTPQRREDEIRRAIWLVSAAAHRGEQAATAPGSGPEAAPLQSGSAGDPLHDHRHFLGMPGMGLMKGMTPERMWMPDLGWMSLQDCHHCTMPLWEGDDAWRNPSVIAQGWAMRVRCPLCARDMSAETKGRAILQIPTEDPYRMLVALSDEQGNLTASIPDAVFLEAEGSHTGCDEWSRAFTSRAAFDSFVRTSAKLAGATPLSFQEWAVRQGEKPDTYVSPKAPPGSPYGHREGEGARP